ncbi:UNVERIFIED_CONTAM: hypothetical protein Sindi_0523900 [Sesamum indicum]
MTAIFPYSDVLNASVGPSASFIWRCITGTRYLIQAGSCWKIGNGRKHPAPLDSKASIVSSSGGTRYLSWYYERHGRFTMKSAFQLACHDDRRKSNEAGKTSSAGLVNWKFIWLAHVPPKVRLFQWTVCQNGLPTVLNLTKGSKDSGDLSLEWKRARGHNTLLASMFIAPPALGHVSPSLEHHFART